MITLHFDFHRTVHDFLLQNQSVVASELGTNLLLPLAYGRTCKQAGVPLEFCGELVVEPPQNKTQVAALAHQGQKWIQMMFNKMRGDHCEKHFNVTNIAGTFCVTDQGKIKHHYGAESHESRCN